MLQYAIDTELLKNVYLPCNFVLFIIKVINIRSYLHINVILYKCNSSKTRSLDLFIESDSNLPTVLSYFTER